MYRAYRLSDGTGKKINVDYRNAVCVIYNDNNEIEEQIVFDDTLENPKIVYRGEEIYLENFLYRPLEDTIDIINNSMNTLSAPIGITDFINTLIKERGRVGFIMEAEVISIVNPSEVKVNKEDDYLVLGQPAVLYALVNPVEYVMNHREWDSGIEVIPVDKAVQGMLEKVIISIDELYFLVMRGLVEMVDKVEYRKKHRYDKVMQRGRELEVRW